MPLALEGIRILDLTTWQQGPGCTVLLADMGADVTKIEDPLVGDQGRGVILHPDEATRPIRAFHEAMNHNKRAMTLNLKSEEGRGIFYRMVQRADVVATNFRVGVRGELGIDHKTLARHNPRIISAVATALGPRGPDAGTRSMDIVGQARSGLLTMLADPEQPLRYVGAWGFSDEAGAVIFCNAVLAALVARSLHGVGQEVTVSQLNSTMTWQTLSLHAYLFTGQQPRTPGRAKTRNPLFNIYQAKDGKWLCIACTPPDRFWKSVCQALGLAHLIGDPRFSGMAERDKHGGELLRLFDAAFLQRDRDEWVQRLLAVGAMAAPVQDYAELEQDPQVAANGYIIDMQHPEAGRVRMLASPISFSTTPTRPPAPAPQFGEHTEAILLEHGYSWEEVAGFRERGVI